MRSPPALDPVTCRWPYRWLGWQGNAPPRPVGFGFQGSWGSGLMGKMQALPRGSPAWPSGQVLSPVWASALGGAWREEPVGAGRRRNRQEPRPWAPVLADQPSETAVAAPWGPQPTKSSPWTVCLLGPNFCLLDSCSPALGLAGCTRGLGRVGWTWRPEAAGDGVVSLGLTGQCLQGLPYHPHLRTPRFLPSQRKDKVLSHPRC